MENKFLGINTLNYIRDLNIKVLDQGVKCCRKMTIFSKTMHWNPGYINNLVWSPCPHVPVPPLCMVPLLKFILKSSWVPDKHWAVMEQNSVCWEAKGSFGAVSLRLLRVTSPFVKSLHPLCASWQRAPRAAGVAPLVPCWQCPCCPADVVPRCPCRLRCLEGLPAAPRSRAAGQAHAWWHHPPGPTPRHQGGWDPRVHRDHPQDHPVLLKTCLEQAGCWLIQGALVKCVGWRPALEASISHSFYLRGLGYWNVAVSLNYNGSVENTEWFWRLSSLGILGNKALYLLNS